MRFRREDAVLIVNASGVPVWVPTAKARNMLMEGARVADAEDQRLSKDGSVGMNVNKVRRALHPEENTDGRRGRKARPAGESENPDS